jgi:hypothetical protein
MDDRELWVLRDRQRAACESLDAAQAALPPDGSAAVLAKTTMVTTYPSTPGAFYACLPQEIDGNETEGGTATYTASSSTPFFAWNAGTAIPPQGTLLVCHAVGGRWVFRYDGASGGGGLFGGGQGGGGFGGGGLMARQPPPRRRSGRAIPLGHA